MATFVAPSVCKRTNKKDTERSRTLGFLTFSDSIPHYVFSLLGAMKSGDSSVSFGRLKVLHVISGASEASFWIEKVGLGSTPL